MARIKALFGEGLTTSEAALWQRQRRLMQPLFQGRRLLPRAEIIAEATAAMLTRWAPFADEGLRLYPPTWVTARTPLADQELGCHRIPARSVLLLSPYVLQRHPAFWEYPERFAPERFTPERAVGRPRFAYSPFGGGPLRCIG